MQYISRIHRMLIKQAESPNMPPWNSGPQSNEGERTNITVKLPQKIVNIQMKQNKTCVLQQKVVKNLNLFQKNIGAI